MDNGKTFPRNLTRIESYLLCSVLPENKIGYKVYSDKINTLVVTGNGRFGGGNFILGKDNTFPDLSFPSSPVFAIGTNICKEGTFDITIHTEVDEEIEFDISGLNESVEPETLTEIKKWNYSEWNPGDKAPGDGSYVREIKIVEAKYILAIAPVPKKIWLHEYESGINFLIPLTNFYNELMRVCRINKPGIALNPSSFFNSLKDFTDTELNLTFISYNKYMKRINIKERISLDYPEKKEKKYFSFFTKGKN